MADELIAGADSEAASGTPQQGQPEPQATGTTTPAVRVDSALQTRAVRAEQRNAEILRSLSLPKDATQQDIDTAITRMRQVREDAEGAELDPEIARQLSSLQKRAWDYEAATLGEEVVNPARKLWNRLNSGERMDPSDFMAAFFEALQAAAQQTQPVAGDVTPEQTAGQRPADNLTFAGEPPIQRTQPAVQGLASTGKVAEGFKALRGALGRS